MRIIERTVRKQGESLHLLLNDGVRLPFKASLVESTKASNSLNNRANGIQGQSFNRTTDASETPIRSGMYFERECDPDNAYLIISSIPEPKYPRLMFLYALRCNERVTLFRDEKRVDPDDETLTVDVKNEYAKDILVNKNITSKKLYDNEQGAIDQTSFYIYCPSCYGAQVLDKVRFRNGVYRVESVNDILTDIEISEGVDVLLLSYKDEDNQNV